MPDTIRVLRVGDSTTGRLATVLEGADRYEVRTAADASAGLERVSDAAVDCVVADLGPPGRVDSDFVESVRERRPEVPIVVLVERSDDELVATALDAGATDCVPKTDLDVSEGLLVHRIGLAVSDGNGTGGPAESVPADTIPGDVPDGDPARAPADDADRDGAGTRSTDARDQPPLPGADVSGTADPSDREGALFDLVRTALDDEGPGRAAGRDEPPADAPGDRTADAGGGPADGRDGAGDDTREPTDAGDGEGRGASRSGDGGATGGGNADAVSGSPGETGERDEDGDGEHDARRESDTAPAEFEFGVPLRPASEGEPNAVEDEIDAEERGGEGGDDRVGSDDGPDGDRGGPPDRSADRESERPPERDDAGEHPPDRDADDDWAFGRVETVDATDPEEPMVRGGWGSGADPGGPGPDRNGTESRPVDAWNGADGAGDGPEASDSTSPAKAAESEARPDGEDDPETGSAAADVGAAGAAAADDRDDGTEEPADRGGEAPGAELGATGADRSETGSRPADARNGGDRAGDEPGDADAIGPGTEVSDVTVVDESAASTPDTGPGEDGPDAGVDAAGTGHGLVPSDLGYSAGESVLVRCPARDERRNLACADCLGLDGAEPRNVLLIRYDRMSEKRLERIAFDAESVTVLSVGYSQPVPDGLGDAVEIIEITAPTDVTRLGIVATDVLRDWESMTAGAVVCYDSLNFLLQYKSADEVFRFLHLLLNQLRATGATAHFHLDPAAADSREVATLEPLFDHVVTVDDGTGPR
ncbi:MAG: response regulator [Halobacteriaceae archaeon]